MLLVTGIHGVGKTTFCGHLSAELGVPMCSASQIIRDQSGGLEPSKLNNSILDNAKLFVDGAKRLLKCHQEMVIDGHAVLLNENAGFVRIPPDIFHDLNVSCVLCLYDDVEAISKRLGSPIPNDIAFLAAFQNLEITHSNLIAHSLNVPLIAYHVRQGAGTLIDQITRIANT